MLVMNYQYIYKSKISANINEHLQHLTQHLRGHMIPLNRWVLFSSPLCDFVNGFPVRHSEVLDTGKIDVSTSC